jgi:hypothetical protein
MVHIVREIAGYGVIILIVATTVLEVINKRYARKHRRTDYAPRWYER